MNDAIIDYNWMPTIADHCVDLSADFYKNAGTSRRHCIDKFNPSDVKYADIVFVKTDFLHNGFFQSQLFPKIQNPFILISGISSFTVGRAVNGHEYADKSFLTMLSSDKLLKWFATNQPDSDSDKLVPIPIGLTEADRMGGIVQQSAINAINNQTPFVHKKNKIYIPYHTLATNKSRKSSIDNLKNMPFVDLELEKLDYTSYLKKMDEYKYIACFSGTGYDTHRYYESLIVGSIPLIEKSPIQKLFNYYQLPSRFIDNWSLIKSIDMVTNHDIKDVSSKVKDFLTQDWHKNEILQLKKFLLKDASSHSP